MLRRIEFLSEITSEYDQKVTSAKQKNLVGVSSNKALLDFWNRPNTTWEHDADLELADLIRQFQKTLAIEQENTCGSGERLGEKNTFWSARSTINVEETKRLGGTKRMS
jgi:hypothetical protein